MSNSHDNEVADILAELRRPRLEPNENPFLKRLHEFAEQLNRNDAIEAEIEQMSHPQVYSLVTCPKYRRDSRNYMLTFFVETSSARRLTELGTEEEEYERPEQLWEALINFLRHSAFPDTLQYYIETVALPLDGFLRVGEPHEPSSLDAAVVVPPDAQRSLGETRPNTSLRVSVEPQPFPFTSEWNPGTSYRWLVSSGYFMSVLVVRAEAGFLIVDGLAKGRLDEYSG